MNNLLAFSLQSALCLSLFYGVYFLLRKDTHFVIKRIYLVLSLVLALVLPLYTVEYEAQTETEQYWMQLLPEINITSTTSSEGIYSISIKDIVIRPYDDTIARAFMNYLGWSINPFLLLFAIYISGVLLLFARLMYQFLYFAYSVKRKGLQDVNGIKVLISKEYYLPYSFFNVVCISKEQLNKTGIEKILSHEKEHIAQKHYIDLLIAQTIVILQWINPLVWRYEKEIKENHEYLADNGVLARGINKTDYQTLIVNEVFGVPMFGLANNFNHSLIKKRIIMMTRIKSTKVAKLKILLMLPMVAFMVYAFAEPVHKATDLTEVALPTDDTTVFWVVEQKPEYIGGMKALVKHIASNTIYPEQAKEEGIQGKVYVKFVVEKDGSVRRAEVARGVHPLLDSEALRVVNSMPIWIPGMQRGKKVAVWFVVPINFTLKDTPKTNCKE